MHQFQRTPHWSASCRLPGICTELGFFSAIRLLDGCWRRKKHYICTLLMEPDLVRPQLAMMRDVAFISQLLGHWYAVFVITWLPDHSQCCSTFTQLCLRLLSRSGSLPFTAWPAQNSVCVPCPASGSIVLIHDYTWLRKKVSVAVLLSY